MNEAIELFERVLSKIDSEWLADYDQTLCDDVKEYIAKQQEKEIPQCSVCHTTKDVEWVGGYQPYRCLSIDCIPF
jgi:hypothetical protein